MSEEVDVKELLKVVKDMVEQNKEMVEENRQLREELDEIKSTPNFQSAPHSRAGGSPSRQKSIEDKIDALLLLDKDDRPETLSERETRRRQRNEGLDVARDIVARWLKVAKDRDIQLRFVKDDD